MILSLDVALNNLGWSVIDKGKVLAFGTIRTEKCKKKGVRVADDNFDRSARIARELHAIIAKYEVKAVIGELPSGGAKSAKAMRMMAMATSITGAVCALLDLPAEWCTPTDVKVAICGDKTASKEDIMARVRELHPEAQFSKYKTHFEHVADSIGAYYALRDLGNLVKIFG